MKKNVAIAFIFAACSTTAMAQSTGNFYIEAAYAMVTTKDTSTTNNLGTFKPTLGRFTLGTVITDNVAVEGFMTQGLSSDSKVISGANVDIKAKTGYGIAVRPFVNLSNDLELFGRVGSIRNEVEATVSLGARSEKVSSKTTNTLYGGGVGYKVDKNLTAVIDYTKLSNKDSTETSMVSIGVRFNF